MKSLKIKFKENYEKNKLKKSKINLKIILKNFLLKSLKISRIINCQLDKRRKLLNNVKSLHTPFQFLNSVHIQTARREKKKIPQPHLCSGGHRAEKHAARKSCWGKIDIYIRKGRQTHFLHPPSTTSARFSKAFWNRWIESCLCVCAPCECVRENFFSFVLGMKFFDFNFFEIFWWFN